VPAAITQIISERDKMAFRGSLLLAEKDYTEMKKRGLVDLEPGQASVRQTSTHKMVQQEGGYAFTDCVPDAGAVGTCWYLADYWQSHNIDDVVPIYSCGREAVLDSAALRLMRKWYPDQELVSLLQGAGVPSKDTPLTTTSFLGTNHKGALHYHKYVHKAYMQEVEKGNTSQFGVAHSPPGWPLTVSPSGATTKSLRDGSLDMEQMRPTMDASWPRPNYWLSWLAQAHNASIDLERDFPYIHYVTHNDMIDQILYLESLGEEVVMAIWDMKSYYRQFHQPPGSWPTHCRTWVQDGGASILMDHRMMFGDKSAASWAMRLSGLVAHLVEQVANNLPPGSPNVRRAFELLDEIAQEDGGEGTVKKIHMFVNFFIDDLPTIAAAGSEETILCILAAVLELLGLEPQGKKVWHEGSFQQKQQALGVLFDLSASPKTATVPQDKVSKARGAIDKAVGAKWVPCDQCQSLLGLLSFSARILLCGSWHLPFTVRALATACVQGVAPMTDAWRSELQWWDDLYCSWNRVSILIPRFKTNWEQSPMLVPHTDASRAQEKGEGGAGAWFGREYMIFMFTPKELELDIMLLEGMVAVMWLQHICENHTELIQGKRFVGRCDNEPFVDAVNSRHSTYPACAYLLSEIHALQAKYSFDYQLIYIKSKLNIGADALSRDDIDDFFSYMYDTHGVSRRDLKKIEPKESARTRLISTMAYGQRWRMPKHRERKHQGK
jgi:hypothetical protein